jgi:DNA gyrase subunit A
MVITSQGKTLKIAADTVSVQGKGAKGVRVLNIDRPDFVIGLDKVAKEEEAEAIADEELGLPTRTEETVEDLNEAQDDEGENPKNSEDEQE